MAQGDGYVVNSFKRDLMQGLIDLDGHTIRIALVAMGTVTLNIDDYTSWTQLSSSYDCAGTNYGAGGGTLAGGTVTVDNGNNLGKFDASDHTWTSLLLTTPASATPSHVVLWDDSASGDPLIAYWELTTATNGGNYTVQWHTDGILTLA